jgi:CcmD family protein
MSVEEKYVAAAYLVVFVAVLVYLLIMSTKLARLEREVGELVERVRAKREPEPEPEPLREEAASRG